MPQPSNRYKIRSKVFKYPGMAAWYFIGVPKKQAEEIRKHHGSNARGWGSLPVQVTLGKTNWRTSIFPDKKSGTYLLPVKADVRKKEAIDDGDAVTFTIEVKV